VQGYKAQFFDKLCNNIRALEGELTEEDGSLAKSVKNTCLFARALHNTFKDMNDIVGMLVMGDKNFPPVLPSH